MVASPASISLGDFHSLLGEVFVLRAGPDVALEARLSEVQSLGYNTPRERGGHESFSLLFHVAADRLLPQGTYVFTHPQLGAQSLFLVPLGPDARGMRLEVVFNFR